MTSTVPDINPPQRSYQNRTLINYGLAGIASLAIFSFAIPRNYNWLAFAIRLGGASAGIAFLIRCDRLPSRIEANLLAQKSALEAEKSAAQLALAEEQKRLKADRENLDRDRQHFNDYQRQEQNRLSEERTALQKQESEASDRIQKQKDADTTWLNQQLDNKDKDFQIREQNLLTQAKADRDNLIAQFNQQLQQVVGEKNATIERLQAEIENYQLIIAKLQQEIKRLNGIQRPQGASRDKWVANQIIDVLLEHEIEADYSDSWYRNSSPWMEIWLRPKEKVKVKKVKDLAEEIQLRMYLDEPPNISVEDGAILFKVPSDAGIKSERQVKEYQDRNKILEPSQDWLVNIVRKANHFRVNGETDSGKSTFVDNLICLMKASLGRSVKFVLIDPKYPLSDWKIEPDYKGKKESLNGLKELADEVENRLEQARSDKDSGRPIRDFEPVLYIVDEIDLIINEHKQEAADLLRVGLKVGRALKVKVAYIGQTPLCSRLKMNKDDFTHSANFFLGENAPRGVEEVGLTTSQKTFWIEQISLRQKAATKDPNEKFYALVKFPSQPMFLARLPGKQAYRDATPEMFAENQNTNQETDLEKPSATQPGTQNPTDSNRNPTRNPENPRDLLERSYGLPEFPRDEAKSGDIPHPELNPETESSDSIDSLNDEQLKQRIKRLVAEGVTTRSDIVYALHNMKPSRSKKYKGRADRVEKILKQLEQEK